MNVPVTALLPSASGIGSIAFSQYGSASGSLVVYFMEYQGVLPRPASLTSAPRSTDSAWFAWTGFQCLKKRQVKHISSSWPMKYAKLGREER